MAVPGLNDALQESREGCGHRRTARSFCVKNNALDLHLSAGLPPMARVDGEMRRNNVPLLEHKQVHSLVDDIMNDKQRWDYKESLETDFSF